MVYTEHCLLNYKIHPVEHPSTTNCRYAAASMETKAGQSMCGTLMNSTFQLAAFR